MVQRVGRFELLAPLGRGAQATVWRAHDPQLQREVALKLLADNTDIDTRQAWLEEARLAGALHHPGIVPVFDAGEDQGQPYIVSECVQGLTLAQRLREDGHWAARDAVLLMCEVLDALAFAHTHGVVHRDLKPSNILLGSDGRPRVMDFGIAARLTDEHDGRVVGTPGYISPEAAAGQAASPVMDVFSAGMLLGLMLSGRMLREGNDPLLALQHAMHVDVVWPAQSEVDVDDALRSIVLRATARSRDLRWPDAASFKAALQDWLRPSVDEHVNLGHGTLNFLLRRMKLTGDFPALSDAVMRIQRITSSDNESLHALSAEILRDVALTNKLLRLVNSAHFQHASHGEVSTVSRAAALVGFSGIRAMALSLVLLEHMGNQQHAERMKGLFLESLLTATLVDQLTPPSREREEAFLAGMMSHLGRMLAEYYFPDEATRIRSLIDSDPERAQIDVLGLSYDALGQGVSQVWGLPTGLRQMMARPPGTPPHHRVDADTERMRWRVRASGELVQALLASSDKQHDDVQVLAERYAKALGVQAQEVSAAVHVARSHLSSLAGSLGLQPNARAKAHRLLEPAAPHTLNATGSHNSEHAQKMLSAGIADVTATLAGDSFKLNEVLQVILETMLRALGAQHVIFCLRDPKTGVLTGRLGLGEGVDTLRGLFKVDAHTGAAVDLFSAACMKGADTLIADGHAANLQQRLPAWYRPTAARSFLLLPMMMKGAAFALIYADRDDAALQPSEQELTLLRTLRNQAVMAFKQTH